MRTISFPFRISANGAVSSTTDTNKIWIDRVRSVVSTQLGDRAMRPWFGVDSLSAVLNVGTPAEVDLGQQVRDSFARHLPSLSLVGVSPKYNTNDNTLVLDVTFVAPDKSHITTKVAMENGNVTSEDDPYEVIR